jgi:hypothetical protein
VRNVVALALTQLGKGGASGVLIDSTPACMPMLVTMCFCLINKAHDAAKERYEHDKLINTSFLLTKWFPFDSACRQYSCLRKLFLLGFFG